MQAERRRRLRSTSLSDSTSPRVSLRRRSPKGEAGRISLSAVSCSSTGRNLPPHPDRDDSKVMSNFAAGYALKRVCMGCSLRLVQTELPEVNVWLTRLKHVRIHYSRSLVRSPYNASYVRVESEGSVPRVGNVAMTRKAPFTFNTAITGKAHIRQT